MLFDINEVENRIGYIFKDKNLLRQAFTHSSYSNEKHVFSNERLEFLGDSVLNFVIADFLYRRYPDIKEGELTRIRASVVSKDPIAEAAEKLGLDDFLLLGEGEKKSDTISSNITADLFESVTGAIYLDSNIFKASKFIRYALKTQLKKALCNNKPDSKSYLSEISQKMFGKKVKYVTLNQQGQAHSPQFTVAAVVNDVTYESATADNKKTAQQLAAKNAIKIIDNQKNSKNKQKSKQ